MKKHYFFIFIFVIFALYCGKINTQNYVYAEKNAKINDLDCKSYLLCDFNTGSVILENESHKKLPIASMTKVASLMLVFDAINEGELKEDDMLTVSKWAAETEGSSAFLDEGSSYKVSDLIMSVVVCSANDSMVALAEGICGSEDLFVKKLNKTVRAMGLKDTNFINSTGLPALDHYSSAHDIVKIYLKVCDNPLYKKYSRIWMTNLTHPSGRKTDIVNTNRLIKTYDGCESGKTGFTNDAGFCLVSSAKRGDMRLVGVAIGAENSKTRFNDMAKMFDYGFLNFENRIVLDSDESFTKINVKNSKIKEVDVYPENDFVRFIKKGEEFNYSTDFVVNKNKAPFEKGDRVGTIYVLDENNIVIYEDTLIVNQDIKEEKLTEIFLKVCEKM